MSLEEKLEDVTELWSPEEDGLYVGQPPKCARHRWRILERRLVTHAADKTIKTKWFRTDGTVAVLPDPLRPYLVRNIISTMEPRPVYLMVTGLPPPSPSSSRSNNFSCIFLHWNFFSLFNLSTITVDRMAKWKRTAWRASN